MPIVTGVLMDFGLQALANVNRNLAPVIEFHPSGNAMNPASGAFYATRPLTVTPDTSTGVWVVTLEQTDQVTPLVWYDIVLTWLDPAGNFVSKDYVPWRLYVPAEGGNFTDLISTVASPIEVWISDDAVIPSTARPQDFMFDPISNDLYRIGY